MNQPTARTQFILSASQIEFLDRFCTRVRRDSGSRLSKRAVLESLIESIPTDALPLDRAVSETHLKELFKDQGNSAAEVEDGERVGECAIETDD
jgi:hypothetical protein